MYKILVKIGDKIVRVIPCDSIYHVIIVAEATIMQIARNDKFFSLQDYEKRSLLRFDYLNITDFVSIYKPCRGELTMLVYKAWDTSLNN